MRLAYYARSATSQFWSEHWGSESPETLLRIAERSPLTDLVLSRIPRGARVLEAGCGLGQYVVLLRTRGRRAVGADWSESPLRACRGWAMDTPLAATDLRRLAFRSGAFDAYVSLGVVEHDADGPDAIVREAHRVLTPGGTLLLSVPYVNVCRRLGGWWIRRQNRRVQEAGGEFYQFALSRGEVHAVLERNGFQVLDATPYDPARILRGAWRRLRRRLGLVDAAEEQAVASPHAGIAAARSATQSHAAADTRMPPPAEINPPADAHAGKDAGACGASDSDTPRSSRTGVTMDGRAEAGDADGGTPDRSRGTGDGQSARRAATGAGACGQAAKPDTRRRAPARTDASEVAVARSDTQRDGHADRQARADAAIGAPACAHVAAAGLSRGAVDRAPGTLHARARALLYSRPALHAFGHMILFTAVRR